MRDPSLKQLESTLLSSKAAGAIKAYRRTFQTWKSFASSRGEVRPFPGKVELAALYLQHVIDTTHSPSAVDSAICGIQWAHSLAGISSPIGSSIVHSISRAAKSLIGTRTVNRKEPISSDVITKLVEASNLGNLLELESVCIFVLAFAVCF